jgi:hypothetical protein
MKKTNSILIIIAISVSLLFGFCTVFAQKDQILHDQNRVIRNKFTVQPKDLLKINTDRVKIVIEEWEKNEVAFITTITLNKSTEKDMENLVKAVELSNNQFGKTINYSLKVDWSGKAKTNNLHGLTEISLKIVAPKDIFYDLKVRYGSVKMENVQNDFNANISYGSLRAEDMFGNKNNIDISYGSLSMEDLHGARNQIDIKYGNFKVYKADQLALNVKYSQGEINNAGSLELDSKGCSLKFGTINSLVFKSEYDNIYVQNKITKIDGEMKYGILTANSLKTSCILSSFAYSKVTINEISKSFTNINISASYSNIKLNILPDQSFAFYFSGRYTDFKDKVFKITDGVYFKDNKAWKVENGFYEYSGRAVELSGIYGKDPNSEISVKIEARYGSVSLCER